jgi:hypothetical protein
MGTSLIAAEERVSAEAARENVHKALPRKRLVLGRHHNDQRGQRPVCGTDEGVFAQRDWEPRRVN